MSLHYMPEPVSHPFNSLRVGLGTLRPLKAWKTAYSLLQLLALDGLIEELIKRETMSRSDVERIILHQPKLLPKAA